MKYLIGLFLGVALGVIILGEAVKHSCTEVWAGLDGPGTYGYTCTAKLNTK